MVVTVDRALGDGKLWVALVYSWNDDLQQFDPFINVGGNATLAGANLAEFESTWHKVLAKVEVVEIGIDTDVVAVVQVSSKRKWTHFTIQLFDFSVDIL